MVTLHVSVWVEIQWMFLSGIALLSRSTWACELKLSTKIILPTLSIVTLHVSVWVEIAVLIEIEPLLACHAPRERVSWNAELIHKIRKHFSHAPRERVSWNRESTQRIFTRMSRSTWACELKFKDLSIWVNALMTSRSTWACELKCHIEFTDEKLLKSHAPRERVSWNLDILAMKSVYSVTLHVSVWVEIQSA